MEEALDRQRQLARHVVQEPPPVSRFKRLMMNPLFYLPLAGLLGGLICWLILEPYMEDFSRLRAEVTLVNDDPFEYRGLARELGVSRVVVVTLGTKEVLVFPGLTRMEPGAAGEPAFDDVADIRPGTIIEATGDMADETALFANAVRPVTRDEDFVPDTEIVTGMSQFAGIALFPIAAVLMAGFLLLAEGISARNWVRMVERVLLGVLLTAVFSVVAFLPAEIAMLAGNLILDSDPGATAGIHGLSPMVLVGFMACRSVAWAFIGAGIGLGMNLVRSTRVQLRNSVVGGVLGGALGGAFFDPIDRFVRPESFFAAADLSRLVGLVIVGACIGVFVALVDRLAREAWIRVRTGPLAGKSLPLYRTPTVVGSAPAADIYLFKDAEIDPSHAAIHRVGNRYEIEDLGSRTGTTVAGRPVGRGRLVSGDQIVLGSTVLQFEERAKRRHGRRQSEGAR